MNTGKCTQLIRSSRVGPAHRNLINNDKSYIEVSLYVDFFGIHKNVGNYINNVNDNYFLLILFSLFFFIDIQEFYSRNY